ncbi:dihydrolipoyl dehydrogenase family protein [Consotaella salsifontis]|uniref:Pyruvate/2-oxoglutarate dehydrogenase complex, dihydrolipoamide dehydrogenase (E3) component n=1 Tax=Consotaella salsifontis TaxID=1365950 RepID=A0A1T4Q3R2_9HYPH|nr:FAD-dependent oxidoreductase [Consotaella salsifontis]SJZ98413.1 Pyruvate/2-oxoglutarate dehydrogenase complex, dihydrolipoamide dehydrogenase (E3) component [Consotaella salsifontis]
MSRTELAPDICVIGGGSGGLTVAAAAASFGVDVVLVEEGAMGGDCLNTGCVPSKALIAAARHAADARAASRFGVFVGEPAIDAAAVHAHVKGAIAAIAPHDSVGRFESLGVKVIQARARFVDARTVEAGEFRIRARRFVLATGSAPAIPPIPGLVSVSFLTNESLFDLDEIPRRLAIIGGGPVGIEMAQAFRRLGAEVVVVERGQALAKEDPELAAIALGALRREGVDLREGADVVRVAAGVGQHAVDLFLRSADGSETVVSASHLLIATGRTPRTAGLGLEAAGIDHGPGGVMVGSDLRTTNRRVYAVGDVAGGLQFTHVAGHQAGLVVRALLFRLPIRYRPEMMPRVTYTDPPLGQVGLTQAEAARNGRCEALRLPYAALDRAQAEDATDGLVKLIVGARGRILGAGVVGDKADEITNLFALAISRRMRVSALAGFVSPYPTLGEAARRLATLHYAPMARRPSVRVLLSLLRRLG